MSNKIVPISTTPSDVVIDPNAVYGRVDKLEERQKDNEETMRAVVIILVVMVGAMIFSLQIANMQIGTSNKPSSVNITIDENTLKALKNIK